MSLRYIPEGYNNENLPPPEGWDWDRFPRMYDDNYGDTGIMVMLVEPERTREWYGVWQERMEALKVWCAEQDVTAFQIASSHTAVARNGARVPTQFAIYPDSDYSEEEACFRPVECPCGHTLPFNTLKCSECDADFHCMTCRSWLSGDQSQLRWGLITVEPRKHGCYRCHTRCTQRHDGTTDPRRSRSRPYLPVTGGRCSNYCEVNRVRCYEHLDLFDCADCGESTDRIPRYYREIQGGSYCLPCSNIRCDHCGERAETLDELDGARFCQECFIHAALLRTETDVGLHDLEGDWTIPQLPGRSVRLVSIEQEFCADRGGVGSRLASNLAAANLSPYNEVMRYHCGNHSHPCHIENDSSVTGGELIYNRLRLDTQEDTDNFQRILRLVIGEPGVEFNLRCGTHIHVDLHRYSIADARNYVTIYSYIEDPLFRLGASGYGDHRAALTTSQHAAPIFKGVWREDVQFGRDFLRRADHTDSLNLSHFYRSFESCQCGAIEFGNIENCECTRPKCTAEWRVFNGTRHPRRLHAYVALIQSITSWCYQRALNPDDFEILGFERDISFAEDELRESHINLIEAWRPRMEWIFSNLIFSDTERDNLFFCIDTSPLKHLGEEFINHLKTLRAPADGAIIPAPINAARNASRISSGDSMQNIRREMATMREFGAPSAEDDNDVVLEWTTDDVGPLDEDEPW